MKFIRTKDGKIYKLQETKSGEKYLVKTNELIPLWNTKEYEIIKQANTIKYLCDLFVYKNKIYEDAEFIKGPIIETIPHGQAKESDKIYLIPKKRDCGLFNGICVFDKEEWKKIYGAIWVLGEEGEPILQSICRFGDKEVFEFL